MRGINLNADGVPARPGVHPGGKRAKSFSQDRVGTAVEDARHLGVAFHRHGGDSVFGAHIDELDSHFHHQSSDPEAAKPAVKMGRDTGGRQLSGERAGREIVHHGN